jgi:catechol 2,3-dioxygenase-like lactoylglutathione lyase family enzyme
MPRLDHVNIHTRDATTMIGFLETVVDARRGYRPPFRNPGHWLYLEGQPSIHLDVVDRDDSYPQGMVNHCAFGPYDFKTAIERVQSTGFPYECAEIPDTEIGQIFVYGPEGLKIELQYKRSGAAQ